MTGGGKPRVNISSGSVKGMAVAAYCAAVTAKPKEKITLRQGARVMMKNWTE